MRLLHWFWYYIMKFDVMKLKDEIIKLVITFEQSHLARLREKMCSAETGVIYIELLSEIRKVSRHLANIAERSDAFYHAEREHAQKAG